MNTPAHLIFGTAAFARPDRKGSFAVALAGSLAPDISLYLMVTVSIWGMGIPAETVFRELYYSDAWQAVFAFDNSFVIWGALLGLAFWRRWRLVVIFAAAGLLHLTFDFPLHTHDARQHFWPVSTWVFESPISYWDNRAHAGIVGPMVLGMSLLLAGTLVQRFKSWTVRAVVGVLALAELMSSGGWRFVF